MKFLIDNISEVEGVYHVQGICYEDGDRDSYIKIDDCFLKAYKNIFKKTAEYNYELVERKDIRDVKLYVKKIKAYGHNLDELYSGMSAELHLVGDGGTDLQKKDVLESGEL